MGWYGCTRDKNETDLEFLQREICDERQSVAAWKTMSGAEGDVIFAAIRCNEGSPPPVIDPFHRAPPSSPDREYDVCYYPSSKYVKGHTFAIIVLQQWNDEATLNFRWKEMHEATGPYYYGGSLEILDLLSPTSSAYALGWREKSREHLQAERSANA